MVKVTRLSTFVPSESDTNNMHSKNVLLKDQKLQASLKFVDRRAERHTDLKQYDLIWGQKNTDNVPEDMLTVEFLKLFQLNNQLSFRCVGHCQMSIMFSCQRETARFSLGPMGDADEYRGIEEGVGHMICELSDLYGKKDILLPLQLLYWTNWERI